MHLWYSVIVMLRPYKIRWQNYLARQKKNQFKCIADLTDFWQTSFVLMSFSLFHAIRGSSLFFQLLNMAFFFSPVVNWLKQLSVSQAQFVTIPFPSVPMGLGPPSHRNVMMRLNLQLTMGTFSLSLFGLMGVAFGMNLESTFEEVNDMH